MNSGIQPLQNINILRKVKAVEMLDVDGTTVITGDGAAFAKAAVVKGLASLEAVVSAATRGQPGLFAAGTTFPTTADLCIVPQIYTAKRFAIDLSPYPAVVAVTDLCNSLPAFDAATPERQPDFVPAK